MEDLETLEHGFIETESAPLMATTRVSRSQALRQAGVQRIQKDMFTVNQLFKDLSGIVIHQGETIQSIDSSVEKSAHNSKLANEELTKTSKRYQQQQWAAIRVGIFLLGFIISVFLLRRMLFSHW